MRNQNVFLLHSRQANSNAINDMVNTFNSSDIPASCIPLSTYQSPKPYDTGYFKWVLNRINKSDIVIVYLDAKSNEDFELPYFIGYIKALNEFGNGKVDVIGICDKDNTVAFQWYEQTFLYIATDIEDCKDYILSYLL